MSQIVVGTAGHIDHGKTSLVKQLTGKNTDHLIEEKRRGMTIDLGFAYLNESITIIDVPGHEKFIRNMTAGAANIHYGLIVIAANDGVMPQTREHIDILSLLGVKNIIVAISKIDLIQDSEWIDLVELEIKEILHDYNFQILGLHKIDNLTGYGVEPLKNDIIRLATNHKPQSNLPYFRMNIDRVFSKTGFGTIVTGTIQNGEIKTGEQLEILPSKLITKVRGIQTHGGEISSAGIGDRAALNLTNIKPIDISRGTVIATPRSLNVTKRIIANIFMTKTTKWTIKNKQRLRFHFGTSEVLGRISGKKLGKGNSRNMIIDLESPIAVAMDEKFVIRSYSPMETIAGGLVINPNPVGNWSEIKDQLNKIPIDQKDRFLFLINLDWRYPRSKLEWQSLFNISSETLQILLNEANIHESMSGILFTDDAMKKSKDLLSEFFEKAYNENPFRSIINFDTIKNKLEWSEDWLEIVVIKMVDDGVLNNVENGICLANYKPRFNSDDLDDLNKIQSIINKSGFEPILIKEIIKESGFKSKRVTDLIHVLSSKGDVENLGKNFWLQTSNLVKVINNVRKHFLLQKELKISDFKKITGLTRKTAIPLLEYLDMRKITIRNNNLRYKGDADD